MTINGSTAIYGVIGNPIAHSLSPAIHNTWLKTAGINAVYLALKVDGADPTSLIKNLPKMGISGVNVTIPHKEMALAAAQHIDPMAQTIGAANTLRFVNGSIEAFNTDGIGFTRSLDVAAPHWRNQTKKACLLGAGGSARAVVAALDDAGFDEIAIVNRTIDRIKPLEACAKNARITAYAWDDRTHAAKGASLLINATSLGLANKDPFDAPFDQSVKDGVAIDLVYKPLETQFLKSASASGATPVDGLGMLVHQAAAAFEIWFGIKPDIEAGRAAALAQLQMTPA